MGSMSLISFVVCPGQTAVVEVAIESREGETPPRKKASLSHEENAKEILKQESGEKTTSLSGKRFRLISAPLVWLDMTPL